MICPPFVMKHFYDETMRRIKLVQRGFPEGSGTQEITQNLSLFQGYPRIPDEIIPHNTERATHEQLPEVLRQ